MASGYRHPRGTAWGNMLATIKSIAIPVRRDLVAPSRRPLVEEEHGGPTDFTLMRQAERMGETMYCVVGNRKVVMTGGNNGQASASSLSILHYHDKITNPQYHAGLAYAAMRKLLFGKAYPKGSHLSKVIATSIFQTLQMRDAQRKMDVSDEERDEYFEEVRLMYYRGDNRLRRLPYFERVREMVRRVCIDDMMPDPAKPRHLKRLRIGLQELHNTWHKETRR